MKVLGVGNALLDVLLRLESDSTLSALGLKKGAMDLIDEATMREIQLAYAGLDRTEAPGGSVCNTMRAMAKLGAKVGYIGKIGDDDNGKKYETEIKKAGVRPFFVRSEGISGCSTVLVSPDGERTMATFLGPAATLKAEDIPDDLLRRYDCLYLEGYLISNEALFLPLLKRASRQRLRIALDLSNFNIVNEYKDLLKKVIPEYIYVLFSNESEAKAYTGLPAREALVEIQKEVNIAVVTIGEAGALVGGYGDIMFHQPACDCQVVDTTGAGDHFAAGFLYGYSLGMPVEQSAQIGTLLSAHVIGTVGAQIERSRWSQIKLKVEDILAI